MKIWTNQKWDSHYISAFGYTHEILSLWKLESSFSSVYPQWQLWPGHTECYGGWKQGAARCKVVYCAIYDTQEPHALLGSQTPGRKWLDLQSETAGKLWAQMSSSKQVNWSKGFFILVQKNQSHKKKYEGILKHGYKFISQVELCSYSVIAIKGDRTTIGLEHCRSGPLGGWTTLLQRRIPDILHIRYLQYNSEQEQNYS